MLQKKCVYQVTTINQPALRHLGTSHFWKVLYNKIPMGQIRWPIFLFFMYMLVLTEKTSIFPKSNMFWILVFSCPKMTLITIITRMTLNLIFNSFFQIWVLYLWHGRERLLLHGLQTDVNISSSLKPNNSEAAQIFFTHQARTTKTQAARDWKRPMECSFQVLFAFLFLLLEGGIRFPSKFLPWMYF